MCKTSVVLPQLPDSVLALCSLGFNLRTFQQTKGGIQSYRGHRKENMLVLITQRSFKCYACNVPLSRYHHCPLAFLLIRNQPLGISVSHGYFPEHRQNMRLKVWGFLLSSLLSSASPKVDVSVQSREAQKRDLSTLSSQRTWQLNVSKITPTPSGLKAWKMIFLKLVFLFV